MSYYPNNTLANFTTKLPQYCDLNGEWEVGLYEIQFPVTWYNVTSKETFMRLTDGQGSNNWRDFISRSENTAGREDVSKLAITDWVKVSPPGGFYVDPAELVRHINDSIAFNYKSPPIRFSFNTISKLVTIEILVADSSTIGLRMTREMTEILGFDLDAQLDIEKEELSTAESLQKARPKKVFRMLSNRNVEFKPLSKKSFTVNRVCDLHRGFYSLYVYCDVVEPTIVGDVKVPLLRTVNISAEDSLTVSRLYQTVQYVPVHRRQFDTIEIDIRDDTGRKVPFQRGKVIVSLHFRLKKPIHF